MQILIEDFLLRQAQLCFYATSGVSLSPSRHTANETAELFTSGSAFSL
jgi:hypothetical protein